MRVIRGLNLRVIALDFCLSLSVFLYPSLFPCLRLRFSLSLSLFLSPSINLSIYLFIYPLVHLSVCLYRFLFPPTCYRNFFLPLKPFFPLHPSPLSYSLFLQPSLPLPLLQFHTLYRHRLYNQTMSYIDLTNNHDENRIRRECRAKLARPSLY